MHLLACCSLNLILTAGTVFGVQAPATPAVGEKVPDFALASLQGQTVRLSDELRRGPVVLVLLRGWPGYQCPFCTRQFADYLAHATDFERSGARVVFVYPGPPDGLKTHADAFIQSREMPVAFTFLLDPEYRFTHLYGLRWDAPGETAYPSTFVLNQAGTVRFAKTSRAHGDRVPAAVVLRVLGGR